MERKSGILMPVFALPSKYGIGSLGKWAYRFVDFLKKSGQTYWQMLPLVATGYCDSPYQTVSGISGNPYFIDLEILRDQRLLTYREVIAAIDKENKIDYGKLYVDRYALLRKAYARFDKNSAAFRKFVKRGQFRDYALFMAMTKKFASPWYEWKDEYKLRNAAALKAFYKAEKEEVTFWEFLQYEFYRQFYALKKYANLKGVKLIGDLPLYPSYDSVEVWCDPKNFLLDEEYKPVKVAGVPPDYFSEDGQLWGNPVYDYEYMKTTDYRYWRERIAHAKSVYDVVRIDHFRGFDRFWAVDRDSATAKKGEWMTAPGREIFAKIDKNGIIAEDLGILDDGDLSLIRDLGLPGMKVLSFAFDGADSNAYLPWNVNENSVVYSGTHDNDTLVGLFRSLDKPTLARFKAMIKRSLEYLGVYKPLSGVHTLVDAVIDIAYASKSALAVIPMTDILHCESDYRINEPGKIGCWRTRIKESVFTDDLALKLKKLCKRYNR